MHQLVVGHVQARARPEPAHSHPWRTTRRHGVVPVERSPGVAAAEASRPETTEGPEAALTGAARDEAVYEALQSARARDVARAMGLERSAVLGCAYRHRQRHRLAPQVPYAAARERQSLLAAASATSSCGAVAERYGVRVDAVYRARALVRQRATVAVPDAVPVPTAPPPRLTVVCEPVSSPVAVVRVSLVDARAGQCRALDGDDGLCCCAPTRPGTSWCQAHHAACHLPRRPR